MGEYPPRHSYLRDLAIVGLIILAGVGLGLGYRLTKREGNSEPQRTAQGETIEDTVASNPLENQPATSP